MKILLIDPPYERLMGIKSSTAYPLGLAYITSLLISKGYDSLYLNLDYDENLPLSNPFSRKFNIESFQTYLSNVTNNDHRVWSEAKLFISRVKPDVVGISSITIKMPSVIRLANIVKECNPEALVVVGGHHAQLFPKEILQNINAIDLIVKGEGEETFLEIVEIRNNIPSLSKFLSNKSLSFISGIYFRDENGNISETEERLLIDNLDDLPYPENAIYIKSNQHSQVTPINYIISSRGCPFNCKYCATNNIWKRKIRYRSVNNVIAEIQMRINNQNDYYFYFYDDCFTLNRQWLKEFSQMLIINKLKINWSCITSPSLVDEEIFKDIVEAGCKKINIAIESGSERILRHCNKNINLDYVRTVFHLAKKYNLSTTAYIMLGFPTETEEDIRKTQSIIRELKPNWVYANVLIPLPGTDYFNWVVKNKLIDLEKAWSGRYLPHLQMNYTGTIKDDRFNQLVDETYDICFKINRSVSNIIKRLPIRHYLKNPIEIITDCRKFVNWRKKKDS
jgi:anaerobic magnesium-protoporphyrin IX monomethyl ester cyclase